MIQSLTACKIWAIYAKSDYTFSALSTKELNNINDQLTTFFYQSESMLNGWALLRYNQISSNSVMPLYRSSIPATTDSIAYWSTVNELLDHESGTIGIGHLRVATSGSNTIPNPHPWMYYTEQESFSLVHNGTVDKNILYNLITNNNTDLSWLELNPPQTFDGSDWRGDGWENVVDSELILLYLMQKIEFEGDILSGIQSALINILKAGTYASQLNIIFSNGTSLFIFGGSNGLYFSESSEHYAIMTYPENSGENNWQGLQNEELITFNYDGITRYPDFVLTESDYDFNPNFEQLLLSPAYPNPFNGSVNFVLEGFTSGQIKISIFSINGNEIDHFFIPKLTNRTKNIIWSPERNVSSGTYILHVSTKDNIQTRKILFIK